MSLTPLPLMMIEPLVRAALLEDLGRAGDVTSNAIAPADLIASARGVGPHHARDRSSRRRNWRRLDLNWVAYS